MEFFAVLGQMLVDVEVRIVGGGKKGCKDLVCYYGAGGCSCVGCYDYASIEYASDDCCAGACGFG